MNKQALLKRVLTVVQNNSTNKHPDSTKRKANYDMYNMYYKCHGLLTQVHTQWRKPPLSKSRVQLSKLATVVGGSETWDAVSLKTVMCMLHFTTPVLHVFSPKICPYTHTTRTHTSFAKILHFEANWSVTERRKRKAHFWYDTINNSSRASSPSNHHLRDEISLVWNPDSSSLWHFDSLSSCTVKYFTSNIVTVAPIWACNVLA